MPAAICLMCWLEADPRHRRPSDPVGLFNVRFVFALDERDRRSIIRLDPELFGSQRPLLPLVYLVYICNQGILFNQWKAKQMSGSREGAP
jgi:hypothetical protein